MPKFLERKLKQEYGEASNIPYKVMNKLGYMHGSKETAKGRAAEEKHEGDMQVRGMVPALNAGMKKHAKRMPPKKMSPKKMSKMPKEMMGMGGFSVKGKGPRFRSNPGSFEERREASHRKANG